MQPRYTFLFFRYKYFNYFSLAQLAEKLERSNSGPTPGITLADLFHASEVSIYLLSIFLYIYLSIISQYIYPSNKILDLPLVLLYLICFMPLRYLSIYYLSICVSIIYLSISIYLYKFWTYSCYISS